MLEIWNGHTGWEGGRVSQPFRCYETPQCLDRTEQVCALKERRGRNRVSGSFREGTKIQYSLCAEDKQVVHTLQRVLGKAEFKAYETQHNVARILWRDGTTNTRHCSRVTLPVQRPCLPCPFQSRGTSGIQPGRGRRRWGRSHRTRGPSLFRDTDSLCCRTLRENCPLCTDFPPC